MKIKTSETKKDYVVVKIQSDLAHPLKIFAAIVGKDMQDAISDILREHLRQNMAPIPEIKS